MRARFSGFVIAAALLLPAAAQAAERRPIVAVFDVEAKGIKLSVSLLERLSDYLSSRLAETGRYMVIPRDDLKKRLLGQKSKSYKQCYDRSCQIEMGREMAADKTIATRVIKFGSRCMLTSTLYDLKKAATEIAATVKGKCGEEELVSSLDKVVDKLSGKKDGVGHGGGGVFSKPEEKKVEKLSEQAGEVKQPGTDLYWMRCPLGQTWSGSSCQGDMIKKDWAQAIKACPAGYRLPTRQEFLNLLGGCDEKVRGGGQGHCASCGKSAMCSSMFGKDSGGYWSSSSDAGASSEAWDVNFDIGLVYTGVKVYSFDYMRCVRGGGGVFSKQEEKEVDKLSSQAREVKQPGSNLVWLRCPLGQTWNGSSCQGKTRPMPWAQAMNACPAGYRLPTRQEFMNLLGGCDEVVRGGGGSGYCVSCGKNSRCLSMFGKDENWYWSSSSYTGDSSHAWDVDFATGPVGIDDKGDGRHVRCVRRGPP